jgi:hypothetical protein
MSERHKFHGALTDCTPILRRLEIVTKPSGITSSIAGAFLVDFRINGKIGRAEGLGVLPRQSPQPRAKHADVEVDEQANGQIS